MRVIPIKSEEAHPWVLRKHYAKRLPSISYAFGLYNEKSLIGVCTFGPPASPFLCIGVAGEEWRTRVLELNRLCIQEPSEKNSASFLVGGSLALLPKPSIVVSYADTGMGHTGYIYQATNFLYTGCTKERTDMDAGEGKHSRHHLGDRTQRKIRTAKHRYIYFCGSKTQKKEMRKALKYPVEPYPKGDNKRYDAGKEVSTQELLF